MIPEEIEDYFLDILDINFESKLHNDTEPIKMELVREPFISAQVTTKYRKEITFELEEPMVKMYTESDYNEGCYTPRTLKVREYIVEHPSVRSTKTVYRDTIKISYPSGLGFVLRRNIKKIIETAIKRLELNYDVSDYQFDTNTSFTSIITSFSLINKDEYSEFQKLIQLPKENHDIRISTKPYLNGINNYYWPIHEVPSWRNGY
jgi:hypothetical protein